MLQRELREHVWVQLPLETYKKVMEFKRRRQSKPRKKRKTSGAAKPHLMTENEKQLDKFHKSLTYHYEKEVQPFVEAHINMVYSYSNSDNVIGLPTLDEKETRAVIGGWLACKILPCVRPMMAIGQDKVIFHSSTMNKMVWMIDGITPFQSKGGTGNGKMVSGTKTRMHGFRGPKFSSDELANINKKREGQSYSGYTEEAARNLQGSARKMLLTKSPFVWMIDYGAATDGYWNANHMLLQVADCMDVWNNLDRMSYIFPLWEFDHSSGHDSERKDKCPGTRADK
jgi:hypothetical protein